MCVCWCAFQGSRLVQEGPLTSKVTQVIMLPHGQTWFPSCRLHTFSILVSILQAAHVQNLGFHLQVAHVQYLGFHLAGCTRTVSTGDEKRGARMQTNTSQRDGCQARALVAWGWWSCVCVCVCVCRGVGVCVSVCENRVDRQHSSCVFTMHNIQAKERRVSGGTCTCRFILCAHRKKWTETE